MSKLDDQILGSLAELPEGKTSVNTYELAKALGVDHQVIVGAAKSLAADNYIVTETSSETIQHWNISKEAEAILKDGSPEYQLFQYLKAHGQGDKHAVPHAELQEKFGAPVAAVGLANGIKAKVLQLNKADGVSTVCLSATEMEDTVRSVLQAAKEGKPVDPKDVKELKRRKLATLGEMATFTLTRGEKYERKRGERTVGDLNPKMLQDGSWKTANFRKYNFKDPAPEVDGGQLHPLLKTRQEFREIMMELGFQEMNTQHWVESSFWNFDSLFIPQQHPARDVQDTFFMSKPATCQIENRELLEKVKSTHERAFRNAWSEAESSRNVLRTHTTGTSAYTLYRLAQMSSVDEQGRTMFKPGRYFSIDRVFRNEQMDRTHLCEFHQVEGFVIGRDISLAKMMHTFNKFFRRIGVEKLRFKPAFNPYTEPSMEVFGYHTGLQKWIEVGNSGLFRPELLGPLGFDEGVSVMAWGLSLERPTMIKYGINSIHELFGHRVDVKFIKRSAIARF